MDPSTIEELRRQRYAIATAEIDFAGTTHVFRYFESSRPLIAKILGGESYPPIPFLADARTILDVGASVGAASLFLHSAYPKAAIWACEPHSSSFALLRANLAPIAAARPFQVGLSDQAERRELRLGVFDFMNNSISACVANEDACESIVLEPALDFARAQGIETLDILKLDTEGCEVPILRSLLAGYTPRGIYVEAHSEKDRREIDRLLGDAYVLFKGTVTNPHRGEFTYVAADALPAEYEMLRLDAGS